MTRFNDDGWRGGAPVDSSALVRGDFDAILFFQVIPSGSLLKQLKCKNVTVVPMFDSVSGHRNWEWSPLLRCKFVNFCQVLHRTILSAGGRSLYAQFFPDPSKYEVISRSGLPKAFFWQRGRDVTWDTVRKLIGTPGVMESVQLHLAADPGRSTGAPDERESQLFRIAQSEWFSTRKDYLSAISKAEVFFAPRIREGIGLSFLEAMAYGACVVAPDLPTMNEYIIHGKTGLLYDPFHPRQMDFSCVRAIGANARELVEAGHARWITQEGAILEFIDKASPAGRPTAGFPLLRAAMGARYGLRRLRQRLAQAWRRVRDRR